MFIQLFAKISFVTEFIDKKVNILKCKIYFNFNLFFSTYQNDKNDENNSNLNFKITNIKIKSKLRLKSISARYADDSFDVAALNITVELVRLLNRASFV